MELTHWPLRGRPRLASLQCRRKFEILCAFSSTRKHLAIPCEGKHPDTIHMYCILVGYCPARAPSVASCVVAYRNPGYLTDPENSHYKAIFHGDKELRSED